MHRRILTNFLPTSAGLQLRMRGFARPVARWLRYFSLNTHYVDGDHSRVSIGHRCGLSNVLLNTASGDIAIGDNCAFGYNVMLLTGRHQFSGGQRASLMSGSGGWGGGADEVPEEGFDINIGSGCWIASGAIVSGGVTLGENCIVLAGAVVTRSAPAHSVLGGVPARVVGDTRELDSSARPQRP